MSFEQQRTERNNLQIFEDLINQASRINSQMTAFKNQFDALRASATPPQQAEMDARLAAFVSSLRATLGI